MTQIYVNPEFNSSENASDGERIERITLSVCVVLIANRSESKTKRSKENPFKHHHDKPWPTFRHQVDSSAASLCLRHITYQNPFKHNSFKDNISIISLFDWAQRIAPSASVNICKIPFFGRTKMVELIWKHSSRIFLYFFSRVLFDSRQKKCATF